MTAYVKTSYNTFEKPCEIIDRQSCCGSTDYYHIAYVSTSDALTLVESGLSWLHGTPDWAEHYRRIAIMKAKREKRLAEEKIRKLENGE